MTVTGCHEGSSFSITPAIQCRLWGIPARASDTSATPAPATACSRQTIASAASSTSCPPSNLEKTSRLKSEGVSDESCACLHHYYHSCALQMPSPRQVHTPPIYDPRECASRSGHPASISSTRAALFLGRRHLCYLRPPHRFMQT
jgi:hypothetical protein